MLDITSLAYLAGLFDGEGSIYIERAAPKDFKVGYRYQLKAAIRIREYWALEAYHQVFGGSLKVSRRSNPMYADIGSWRLCDKSAALLIDAILPYLRLKRRQALIAIEFRKCKETFAHGYRVMRTPYQLAEQERFYEEMRTLNARSISRINQ